MVPCNEKVLVGGNHDYILEALGEEVVTGILSNCKYSINRPFILSGLTFYCCPLSQGYSSNKAFQSAEFRKECEQRAQQSAGSVDVLITHGSNRTLRHLIQPRMAHIHGHYHAHYGVHYSDRHSSSHQPLLTCCSSIMDARYQLTNVPIVIDIPR